jgi:hypothetical protein
MKLDVMTLHLDGWQVLPGLEFNQGPCAGLAYLNEQLMGGDFRLGLGHLGSNAFDAKPQFLSTHPSLF